MVKRLAMAYFGGAVAALFASTALWLFAEADVLLKIGVALAPPYAWNWLSTRVLFGSLLGMAYPLVLRQGFSPVRSGLVLSLLPSALELLVVYPARDHGFLGLSLGSLTPLVVLLTNALWGWALARIVKSGS